MNLIKINRDTKCDLKVLQLCKYVLLHLKF